MKPEYFTWVFFPANMKVLLEHFQLIGHDSEKTSMDG